MGALALKLAELYISVTGIPFPICPPTQRVYLGPLVVGTDLCWILSCGTVCSHLQKAWSGS